MQAERRAEPLQLKGYPELLSKEGDLMRKNLKEARKNKGLTQQAVADHLDITLVYYQKIESGDRTGDFRIWDTLEDLFSIHQRKLREILKTHHDTGDSR